MTKEEAMFNAATQALMQQRNERADAEVNAIIQLAAARHRIAELEEQVRDLESRIPKKKRKGDGSSEQPARPAS